MMSLEDDDDGYIAYDDYNVLYDGNRKLAWHLHAIALIRATDSETQYRPMEDYLKQVTHISDLHIPYASGRPFAASAIAAPNDTDDKATV